LVLKKIHFLNYFANQINNLSYGKGLALKMQCKSNQDMLDFYPKITESLKRILLEKNESELVNEILRILADRINKK